MRIMLPSSKYSAICDRKSGFRLISLNRVTFQFSDRVSLLEMVNISCQNRSLISSLLSSMYLFSRYEVRQLIQQSQKGQFWKMSWRYWLFIRLGGSLMPAWRYLLRSKRVILRLCRARCSRCSGESQCRWATKSSRILRTIKVRILERLLSRSLQMRAYCMSALTNSKTEEKKGSQFGEEEQPTLYAWVGLS